MQKTLKLSCLVALLGTAAPAIAAADKQEDDLRAMVSKEYASVDDALRAAMAGSHRKSGNATRDYFRHPFETLTFFGLQRTSKVIELSPGRGWYTELLAPVLRQKGKLKVTVGKPKPGEEESSYNKDFKALLTAQPLVFDKVEMLPILPPDDMNLGPAGSADMVVTFRNLHNWLERGYMEKSFAAAFKVLRKGGVFGIVEHRAKPDAKPEDGIKSGYLPEAWVIQKVEAAGFKLQKKSEINANPRDTKDYKEGVWTLPPVMAMGASDREKYVAIGESDRMTLKFVKP